MVITIPYITVPEFKNGDGVNGYSPRTNFNGVPDTLIANTIRNMSMVVNQIVGWVFERYEGGYLQFLEETSFPIKLWERVKEVVAEATDNYLFIDYDIVSDRDVEDRQVLLDGVTANVGKFEPKDAFEILGPMASQTFYSAGVLAWMQDNSAAIQISPDEFVKWIDFLSDNMIDNSIVPVPDNQILGATKSQLETNNYLWNTILSLVAGVSPTALIPLSNQPQETVSGIPNNASTAHIEIANEIIDILNILGSFVVKQSATITFDNPNEIPVPLNITDFDATIKDQSQLPDIFNYFSPSFLIQKDGRLLISGNGTGINPSVNSKAVITFFLTDEDNNVIDSDTQTINETIQGNDPSTGELSFELAMDIINIDGVIITERQPKVRWAVDIANVTYKDAKGTSEFSTVGEGISQDLLTDNTLRILGNTAEFVLKQVADFTNATEKVIDVDINGDPIVDTPKKLTSKKYVDDAIASNRVILWQGTLNAPENSVVMTNGNLSDYDYIEIVVQLNGANDGYIVYRVIPRNDTFMKLAWLPNTGSPSQPQLLLEYGMDLTANTFTFAELRDDEINQYTTHQIIKLIGVKETAI